MLQLDFSNVDTDHASDNLKSNNVAHGISNVISHDAFTNFNANFVPHNVLSIDQSDQHSFPCSIRHAHVVSHIEPVNIANNIFANLTPFPISNDQPDQHSFTYSIHPANGVSYFCPNSFTNGFTQHITINFTISGTDQFSDNLKSINVAHSIPNCISHNPFTNVQSDSYPHSFTYTFAFIFTNGITINVAPVCITHNIIPKYHTNKYSLKSTLVEHPYCVAVVSSR